MAQDAWKEEALQFIHENSEISFKSTDQETSEEKDFMAEIEKQGYKPIFFHDIPLIAKQAMKENVKEATQAAIKAIKTIPDVVKISAGNYGGNLGEYKIRLLE